MMEISKNQTFENWQLCNIKKFGIDWPMFTKMWISADNLKTNFDGCLAKDVNPVAIQPEGSLGHQWYEWLAEAGMNVEPECEGFILAARYFSWNYPQLKMVIHNVRADLPKADREFFTDEIHFLVEFYD